MAAYLATIEGMKPIILKGGSKPKALDTLVTIVSLTGEQMIEALESGATVYKKGDPLEPVEKKAPEATSPERRVNIQTGMVEQRDPGQAGLAAGYRDDRPATLAELAEAAPGAMFRVEGGKVQTSPEGSDDFTDVRDASEAEIAEAAKPKKR